MIIHNMVTLTFFLSLVAVAVVAGLFGSMVGLGGGIIIVPILTFVYHIDIRLAIGASLIAVIATSSVSAIGYVSQGLANLRTGLFLEMATTLGALTGALVTTYLPTRVLFVLFGLVLLYSAATMYWHRRSTCLTSSSDHPANSLALHGHYFDAALHQEVKYKITHTKLGLGLMYLAGVVSALLGTGAGSLKVPALDLAMHMPIKASTATSNFMMGVTAAAGAAVYFARGQISPTLAAPIALGILAGAAVGSYLFGRVRPKVIYAIFLLVLIVTATQMLKAGLAP
jgi:uncharacterized membrane protein YfcA